MHESRGARTRSAFRSLGWKCQDRMRHSSSVDSETMNTYYPVYIEMRGQPCVVIGGGKIAEGKVEGLLAARANVTVISPDLTVHLRELVEEKKISCARLSTWRPDRRLYSHLCHRPGGDQSSGLAGSLGKPAAHQRGGRY